MTSGPISRSIGPSWEQFFALFHRYKLPFLLCFIAIFAAAILISFAQTPKYNAAARVMVDPGARNFLPTEELLTGIATKEANIVDTQVEALHSIDLARRVAKQLNLVETTEFGTRVTGDRGPEATAAKLLETMDIRRAGETYLIDIIAESEDPVLAVKIANAFAQNHLAQQISTKRNATLRASELLAERIEEMAGKLEQAEHKVQRFKIENGLMSVNGTTLAEQSIAAIDNDLARAQGEERAAQGRLGALHSAGTRWGAAQSPALEQLTARRATENQNWQQIRQKFGERHPDYQAAAARVDQIERAIVAETARARAMLAAQRQREVDRLAAEAQGASQKRASLAGSVDNTRIALASTNKAQVRLNILQRDAEAVRATYEAYLGRYQEIRSILGTEDADSRIVSLASVPLDPTKPDKVMNLLFGGILGLATAFSLVAVMASTKSNFSTPLEIENRLDVDALPSLPILLSTIDTQQDQSFSIAPENHIIEYPQSIFAEQFRKFLSVISIRTDATGSAVVAVTSPLPDEGKTTSAICMARLAASSGTKAILVDCDLRCRSASNFAKERTEYGLIEYLEDGHDLSIIVRRDTVTSLDILPISVASTQMFSTPNLKSMNELTAKLRDKYDLVILDLPPLLPVAEAQVIAKCADTTVLLCRWRSTPISAVEEGLGMLAGSKADIAGVALTMVDWRKQAREGFGDPVFYQDQYRGYSSENSS